jgi:hypothetical protein
MYIEHHLDKSKNAGFHGRWQSDPTIAKKRWGANEFFLELCWGLGWNKKIKLYLAAKVTTSLFGAL